MISKAASVHHWILLYSSHLQLDYVAQTRQTSCGIITVMLHSHSQELSWIRQCQHGKFHVNFGITLTICIHCFHGVSIRLFIFCSWKCLWSCDFHRMIVETNQKVHQKFYQNADGSFYVKRKKKNAPLYSDGKHDITWKILICQRNDKNNNIHILHYLFYFFHNYFFESERGGGSVEITIYFDSINKRIPIIYASINLMQNSSTQNEEQNSKIEYRKVCDLINSGTVYKESW